MRPARAPPIHERKRKTGAWEEQGINPPPSKENVIMGRLIPAGTGLNAYKKLTLNVQMPAEDELPLPIPTPAPEAVQMSAGRDD